MTEIVVANTDGFAVQENAGASMIIGKMVKFLDGHFVVDKTETLPANAALVAVGVITAWVRWGDKKPIEHRITQPGQAHPYRDGLPDLDETKWPPGLNDEPSDPWRDTRYLHLIDPNTGGRLHLRHRQFWRPARSRRSQATDCQRAHGASRCVAACAACECDDEDAVRAESASRF